MPSIANLDDFRAALGVTETDQDALLTRLLDDATGIAAQLIGRPILRVEDLIEYPTESPPTSVIARLSMAPVELVSSVKQAYAPSTETEFLAIEELTEITDFVLHPQSGELEKTWGAFHLRPRCLRVVYTAGWADIGTDTEVDGAIAPVELQRAVIDQATRMFNRRRDKGLSGYSAGGQGSAQLDSEAEDVTQSLMMICKRLRRVSV